VLETALWSRVLHVACDRPVVVSDLFESFALNAFLFFISFSYFQNVPSEYHELPGRAEKLGHGLRGNNVPRLPLFRPVLALHQLILPYAIDSEPVFPHVSAIWHDPLMLFFECLDLVFVLVMILSIAPSMPERCKNIHVGCLDLVVLFSSC